MKKPLKKQSLFSNLKHSKLFTYLSMGIIILVLPIIVIFSKQQTTIEQHAAGNSGTYATGTLTFYNSCFVTQTINGGTVVTGKSGVSVTTNNSVTIPAAIFGGNYGTINVSAHAVLTGSQGNIPANDIYIVNIPYANNGCTVDTLKARNFNAFNGGSGGGGFNNYGPCAGQSSQTSVCTDGPNCPGSFPNKTSSNACSQNVKNGICCSTIPEITPTTYGACDNNGIGVCTDASTCPTGKAQSYTAFAGDQNNACGKYAIQWGIPNGVPVQCCIPQQQVSPTPGNPQTCDAGQGVCLQDSQTCPSDKPNQFVDNNTNDVHDCQRKYNDTTHKCCYPGK
ncbi:MAG: baseplate J/gp47 family protein [Ktedonobacteraceae bacterium]